MVDLHRQYLGIRDEVDRAIGDVIAETEIGRAHV